MRKLEKKEKNFLIYGLFITVAIILVPILIRFLAENHTLIGEQAYLHSSLAENILNKEHVYGKDRLEVYYTPYHYLLAAVGYFIGIKIASIILPLLLGIGSILIFYFLLEKFMPKLFDRFSIILAFVLSPAYIYLSICSNPHSLAIFLSLLGFWFFLKDEKQYLILSAIFFGIASLTSIFNGFLIILVLIFYSIKKRSKRKQMFFILFLIMIMYFFIPLKFYYIYEVSTSNIIKEQISDFGGKIGFGIFHIILFVLGIIASWGYKNRYYVIYLTLIPLIILLNYFWNISIYLNFLVAIFAGLGIKRTRKIQWQFNIIKYLSFLIIICGLLFSTISYSNRISSTPPNNEIEESLIFLQEASSSEDIIFSYYQNGYYIQNIAKRKVLLDNLFYSIPKLNEKLSDSDKIFESRNLETTKKLLNKYSIDYIWIDKNMKNLVWKEDEEGLLFLFRNNETFKNIYSTEEVEIWEIKS